MTNKKLLKILKGIKEAAVTTGIAAIKKNWKGKGGKYLKNY